MRNRPCASVSAFPEGFSVSSSMCRYATHGGSPRRTASIQGAQVASLGLRELGDLNRDPRNRPAFQVDDPARDGDVLSGELP